MSNKAEITIRIPSDASSQSDRPYLEHAEFIKYCAANKVPTNESDLEQYEKKKLLYPCYRLLYPREFLRRVYHARHTHSQSYNTRNDWEPLLSLENEIMKSQHWMYKEFDEAIEYGHPLDKASFNKHPYLFAEMQQQFKSWNQFKVIVGKSGTTSVRARRAKHYYAPWKIFLLNELNEENIDELNRATGSRRGWGLSNKTRPGSLSEFIPFFRIMTSFAYRRSLLTTYYFEKTSKKQHDWEQVVKKRIGLAELLYSDSDYATWIRFLRKLIEIHEHYEEHEKILLSLELKRSISRSVLFLEYATDYTFERICDDVSGGFKNSRSLGMENGVLIYAGRLEEMFADEKWDLEHNVRWRVNHALQDFNNSLNATEKLPATLGDDLVDDLSKEANCTALVAIRKINNSYFERGIWRENEVWSGIRDLAVSVEVHGKDWIGGSKLNEVLTRLYPSFYNILKRKTGIPKPTDASNASEFLEKLKIIQEKIPSSDERCGRHLLIAHLTRNFANHQKGLIGKNLHDNLPIIYSSLLGSLFVLYAGFKNV